MGSLNTPVPPTNQPSSSQNQSTLLQDLQFIESSILLPPHGASGNGDAPTGTNPPANGQPRQTETNPRTSENSVIPYVPPRIGPGNEIYQDYINQEAEHYHAPITEKGVAPCILPSGRDINNPVRWEGIQLTLREKFTFAWGAAHSLSPYGLAALINQGAPLSTAIHHTLNGIDPAPGIMACYHNPPVWPVPDGTHVVVGHNSKVLPTTNDLTRDLNNSERAMMPSEVRTAELSLAQSAKLRVRTYKRRTMEGPLTQARTGRGTRETR